MDKKNYTVNCQLPTVHILQGMKYFSHLNTATRVIQEYNGPEPLHLFIKKFFVRHKKYGSKDRKRISQLCYVLYRVGRAFQSGFPYKNKEQIQQIIVAGLFLCSNETDELLAIIKPRWNEEIGVSISEKTDIINHDNTIGSFRIEYLFPEIGELSEGINKEAFNLSHLQQPSPFVRIRPGYQESVMEKLGERAIHYKFIPPSAVSLPNGVKVDDVFAVDKEVVVQDLSSQRLGEFLQFGYCSQFGYRSLLTVWDCCAASGGKSILTKDILGNIDLTVSDIRESILTNLKKRFSIAGITNYKSFIADLSSAHCPLPTANYDLILADLPCTGSGTWGRTPEQLYFFEPSAIKKYSQLQKKIVVNIIPHLKASGKLLYVTCSVFKEENEEIIRFILENFPLKVEKMEVLKGYDQKADTMFAALLSRL